MLGEMFSGIRHAEEMERACKAEMLRQQKMYNEMRENKIKYVFKSSNGVNYIVNDEFVRIERMTREEAERKIYSCFYGTEKRKGFLDGLEALGLIKFEEPAKEKPVLANRFVRIVDKSGVVQEGTMSVGQAAKFEQGLNDCGFKIVKV